MSEIYHEVVQGTPEWLALRLGKITGTRLKDVMKSNNLPLLDEMIAEKLTGEWEEVFVNYAMQRGNDLEPLARAEYSELTGQEVHEIGFITKEGSEYLGLSPDGFVGADGAVEFKCPSAKKHIEYIRTDRVPADYKAQILMYFIVADHIEWVDFVSYHPSVAIKPINVVRVTREDVQGEIDAAMIEINKFVAKLEKYYDKITF